MPFASRACLQGAHFGRPERKPLGTLRRQLEPEREGAGVTSLPHLGPMLPHRSAEHELSAGIVMPQEGHSGRPAAGKRAALRSATSPQPE